MSNRAIVVGLDESPSGRAALQWAAEQARLTGSVLRAIHVLDWPYGLDDADVTASGALHRILTHDQIEDLYRGRITRVFDELHPRPDWLMQFAQGEVGPVLVHQAERAALLVVGTREHVGLGRLLAGSVSHYCLSHALCPDRGGAGPQSAGEELRSGEEKDRSQHDRDRRVGMMPRVVRDWRTTAWGPQRRPCNMGGGSGDHQGPLPSRMDLVRSAETPSSSSGTINEALDRRLDSAAAHAGRNIPIAAPEDTVDSVLQRMRGVRFDCAAVVAVCSGPQLVGLITIERLLAAPGQVAVATVMDAQPPVVAPGLDQEHAAWLAAQRAEPGLAVVDEKGQFRGLISRPTAGRDPAGRTR